MKTILKIQKLFFAFGLVAAFFFNDVKAATVFPIATNSSTVQMSGGIAFDGTNYLVGMLVGTNIVGQLVSTNGALIGSQIIVGGTPGFPAAAAFAFGQTNYLVAWSDNSISSGVDMYGQFISRSGAKVGSKFNLLQTQGSHGFQTLKALASDGTNFLAVWQDKNNGYFYGQLVTLAGTLSGSEFLISNQQQNGNDPAVTFGKTNYLVVWQSNNNDTGYNDNTYGEFISRSGSAGSPFQISQTVSLDQNPLAIAFDGTNYFVIWNLDTQWTTNGAPIWNLYGRLVSQTGTFPGNELVINTNQPLFPSLAFDGANYLFSWSYNFDTTNSNKNIFSQFLNRSANSIGPVFSLFQAQGTNSPLFVFRGVLFDGNKFAVVAMLGSVIVSADGGLQGFASAAVYGAFIPASTTSPMLTASNRVGTQFPLQLTGTPGINYAMQISTNLALSNWTAVVTNSPTNGTFSFTDTHATNASRFYRAVKQ
jgi:hypothetical protein